MSEIKLPFTQSVGIVIAGITVIVTLAGYVLFFQSQSRLNAQIKSADELKEKYSQVDNTLNEMKSKYDNVYEDMKKVLDDLQDAKAKFQDCQQKYDALESRYDALSRQGAANSAPGTTTTTDQDHPVKGLDNPTKPTEPSTPVPTNAPVPTTNAPVPTPNVPTATPPASSNSTLPTQTQASYQCPSIETVSSKVSLGSWEDNKLNWWVDFTSRPMNEGERVGALTKMIYDGKTVACYYALGIDGQQSWLVIKANSKDSAIKVAQGEGWSACTTGDCQSMCDSNNLGRCTFTLQN